MRQAIAVQEALLNDSAIVSSIENIAEAIVEVFKNDRKVLLCGNGGSAADAQHLAAELSGRFYIDRPPLFAEALHVNTSYLTATANDYSFANIYSRLVTAKGRKGDVLIALSTSGKSANILRALSTANEQDLVTVGFTGAQDANMEALCHHYIAVPSADTPRIQEAHILIGHIVCEIVERALFGV